jgi:hypothetical protein
MFYNFFLFLSQALSLKDDDISRKTIIDTVEKLKDIAPVMEKSLLGNVEQSQSDVMSPAVVVSDQGVNNG